MKAAPFDYVRPGSVSEALRVLADGAAGEDVKVIAGGQSLVPMMVMRLVRPGRLVDLNHLPELAGIRHEDGFLTVGAMTRQRVVERDPQVGDQVPLLARALPWVSHRELRNRGTVGGSIAHADPAAELPCVAALLEAEIVVTSVRGRRALAGRSFVTGPFQTLLEPDEVVTAVRFPVQRRGDGFSFQEIARRHGDFALAGVAVALNRGQEGLTRAEVAYLGMADMPVVLDATEHLSGDVDEDKARRAATALVDQLQPSSDMHASAAYRRRLARVLTARALLRAWTDAATTRGEET